MLIASLKNTFNSIKSNPITYLFSFLFMPLLLAFMMPKFQGGLMSGKIDVKPMAIRIVDEDQSDYSQMLQEIFRQEESKKYFLEKEEEEILITLPKGFKERIVEENKVEAKIESKVTSIGFYDLELTKGYLESIGNLLLQAEKNTKIIDAINKPEEMGKVLEELTAIQAPMEYKKEKLEASSNMNGLVENTISMIQFIFVTYLMTVVMSSKKLSDTTGVYVRVGTLPVNNFKLQLTEVVSSSLALFVFALLYILIARMAKLGFSQDLPKHLLAALVISITVGAFTQLMENIKKEVAIVVVYVILYGQVVLGGMIGPVNRIFKGTIVENIMFLNLNSLLVNPFMDIVNQVFSVKSLMISITVGIVSLILLYVKTKMDKVYR